MLCGKKKKKRKKSKSPKHFRKIRTIQRTGRSGKEEAGDEPWSATRRGGTERRRRRRRLVRVETSGGGRGRWGVWRWGSGERVCLFKKGPGGRDRRCRDGRPGWRGADRAKQSVALRWIRHAYAAFIGCVRVRMRGRLFSNFEITGRCMYPLEKNSIQRNQLFFQIFSLATTYHLLGGVLCGVVASGHQCI